MHTKCIQIESRDMENFERWYLFSAKEKFILFKNCMQIKKLNKTRSYILDGFHPDFFLSLIRILNCQVILTAPDECFGIIIKYFSTLWDDGSAIFLSGQNTVKHAPPGFVPQQQLFFRRSKECLSVGVNNIKTIVRDSVKIMKLTKKQSIETEN